VVVVAHYLQEAHYFHLEAVEVVRYIHYSLFVAQGILFDPWYMAGHLEAFRIPHNKCWS
jgi:hypothetical protein